MENSNTPNDLDSSILETPTPQNIMPQQHINTSPLNKPPISNKLVIPILIGASLISLSLTCYFVYTNFRLNAKQADPNQSFPTPTSDAKTVSPALSITPTRSAVSTTIPTSKPTVKPTVKVQPTNTSTTTKTPTSTPHPTPTNTPLPPTPTPTHTPNPPTITISFPQEGQTITQSNSQICIVDVPTGGDTSGLNRRQNINNQGWTGYTSISTLCFNATSGSNSVVLQYKNSYGEESPIYTRNFTYQP